MSIINILAVVPASDFEASAAWYEKVLGSRGKQPMEGEDVLEWQLTPSAGMQLINDPDQAGSVNVTIGVDDVDSYVGLLAERGLTTSPPSTQQGIRIAAIDDPDGNRITFGQKVGVPA